MTYNFSAVSKLKMHGIHPDLRKVMDLAIKKTPIDFRVTEGLRTMARQRELLAAGASQTLNSRHLTGHAVDVVALVGGKVRWDWPLYGRIADAVKLAAAELNIPIIWGGDWKSLRDGPHFELDRRVYK